MTGKMTWSVRPRVPATVRTRSLRDGLLFTFGVIQAVFVVTFIAVYIAAEVEKNGDGFHDLGVLIGRDLLVRDLQQWWMLTTLVVAAGFAALYFYLKDRWSKE